MMEFVNHTALWLELKLNALRAGRVRLAPLGGAVTAGAAALVISLQNDDSAVGE
ncbi:hypothetical protein [Mesorhizobium wenxiniae]|uniref:hypothetical protein n=1 Tax=Mesorhizobium wenxiniae TaxID=2014805 RepID=UPI0013FD93C5|nr:hypothetical protein [Mesorhizobium wenxiniae]